MNLKELKQTLNVNQYQAVALQERENALILAGAGSGKTRILTHRVGFLCDEKSILPHQILCVTFTNKAATELKERLQIILKRPVGVMWIGTFHGLAYRMLQDCLRKNNELGTTSSLQIIDPQDQLRIIKQILKNLSLDANIYKPQKIRHFINAQKDDGKRPNDIVASGNFFIKKSVEIYTHYQQYCDANNLLDFAEILLKSYEILRNNEAIRIRYQQQFSHILVDEFQDTNTIQYEWIRLLYGSNSTLFCVGDDDQSIYGWRGAKITNIHNVKIDFKPINFIKLEQNYRSTGHILNASNVLISNNKGRMDKSLWTDSGDGEKIDIFQTTTDKDEAYCVVNRIKDYLANNILPQDCAILYRTNAQSRLIEEKMIAQNIPYEIYGGLRFFERAEIKNAISYLKLLLNPYDDIAFIRVVNTPPRGLGRSSLEQLQIYANQTGNTLWQVAQDENILNLLSTRAKNSLHNFVALIQQLTLNSQQKSLEETISIINDKSTLISYYSQSNKEIDKSKVQNLDELVSAANQFEYNNQNQIDQENETINIKQDFIDNAALNSANDADKNSSSVQLMTIHSAKGLEFPYVFIIGLEEGLFPSMQSQENPDLIDEERRLCYVAMTRAMKKLHLSYARERFLWGKKTFLPPSKFLSELLMKHLNIIKSKKTTKAQPTHSKYNKTNIQTPKDSSKKYTIGDTIVHTKFGIGKVLNYEGKGESERLEINFKNHGKKWLILAYAKVVKV